MRQRGLAAFLWQATIWRVRAARRWIRGLPAAIMASIDAGRFSIDVERLYASVPWLKYVVPRAVLQRAVAILHGFLRRAIVLSRTLYYMSRRVVRAMVAPVRSVVRALRKLVSQLTLASHRGNAVVFWPGVRGLDLWVLSFWLALLRFHKPMLWGVCLSAPWLRRRRRSLPGRPSHVLHVTASFDLGGTQTQIKNLCLSDCGMATHEVTEIFPEHNYLYRRGVIVDAARYGGHGRVSRLLGRLVTYPGTRSSQIVQIVKLVKDFRASRPEVVVGWGHEISMITFVAAAIARVPHIVFCIRTFNPSFGWVTPEMGRLLRASHARMVPHLSRIIVNSTPLRRDYAAWLDIDEGRVTVCANGIDAPVETAPPEENRRRIRQRYGVPDDALVLIHVGRFSAEKGQMSLLEANAALLERHSGRPFYWLLCGDGVTMPEARGFAEANGFSNVVFAGRIDEVPAHLHAADIFVMPSDFEGMPNAMMEAMALGVPAISTDRSGAVDVARDGLEALYYSPRDVPRLVEHVSFLIDHQEARREMGARARARMKEFSISRAVAAFNRALAELFAQPQAPPR